MIISIEAIYENGVLRPTRPLPLKEQEVVRITIEPEISNHRQSRWYEEGPLKGPLGHSKFNSPWF